MSEQTQMESKIKIPPDGFVRLLDWMGTDKDIVDAARISYHREGSGNKIVKGDETLLRYLMRNQHWTPFEMCDMKFHVRCPMDVWRQWIRHRTANVNEYSTRYSVAINSAATTKPDEWRAQDKKNRQGSEGMIDSEPYVDLDGNPTKAGTRGHVLTRREKEFHEKSPTSLRTTFGIRSGEGTGTKRPTTFHLYRGDMED